MQMKKVLSILLVAVMLISVIPFTAFAAVQCPECGSTDVGRILRTFKIKKNVEVTDNGKDNF